ncbi:TetR/AcrR family transcriptional regulator [Microlunatus speluncae]|uniref:TetR/AcrR family transcriptional regulator n=1 Tax=Microlunatus speluncae TaxID=2594267 RepID=UPI00126623AC|nr:TetR family transcriptional regulator [Microlunatus speluncae]
MTGRDALLERAIEHLSAAGVGAISLRGLAQQLGTSHRMLIYHFGSREGLLAAVVAEVERRQRELLPQMIDPDRPTIDQSLAFWQAVVEASERHGRLFFELAAHAMQDQPHARPLRRGLIDPWLAPLEDFCRQLGVPEDQCARTARMTMGTARGLLFDLLLTGDHAEVDAAALQLNELLLIIARVSPKA